MSHCLRLPTLLALLTAAAVTVTPVLAEAQRRGPRGPAVRQVVYIGGVWGGLRPVYYDPFYQGWGPYRPYGQWGPWGPWGPYGRYGFRDDSTASLRLDVEPRETEVFVDGYAAGVVDDFDGIFQRLRLRPGEHELVLYLPGHRTIRQSLYLNPGVDQKLRFTLEPLGPGETNEPRPRPDPERDRRGEGPDPAEPPARPGAERRPADREPPARVEVQTPRASFGTLVVRVQPADAEILLDGERWSAPAGQERISIQLAEGRHRIEVRKDGFARYTEEVLIRRNATLTLNVSLTRGVVPPLP